MGIAGCAKPLNILFVALLLNLAIVVPESMGQETAARSLTNKLTPNAAPDPFVFLAGGGVVPATSYARYFSKAFTDLRQHRDIVLIDQRGSWKSNSLDCDLSTDPANADYRDETRFVEAVRRCRKELEQKADLRYYNTPIAMDDLDAVREWLGYLRINIYRAVLHQRAPYHPAQSRTQRYGPCVAGIVQAFVAAGGLQGLDTSCLEKTEDLSFALRADEFIN